MSKEKTFIPALRFNWLTGIFDPLLKYTMPEKRFKSALIDQAKISPSHSVLDFGCGSLTLTLLAKQKQPQAAFTGVDVDEKILTIARKKLGPSNSAIRIDKYDGLVLPYNDSSFDRVITSLVFHHLTTEQKESSLKEIKRILKPGGELHIADWGKPSNFLMRFAFYSVQLLDGFKTTRDNVKGLLPEFIRKAGFKEVSLHSRFNTIYGTLQLYKTKKTD
ncbi:MAG: class I SAM-dependent methyltransferase [Bacteroidota bacterium]